MAIKAGQILHVAGGFVVDRIQTGGAGNLSIPQDKVYELGNYQSVGVVRDVPDLTFSLDCLDVGTEVEAILTGSATPSTDADGTKYDLSLAKAIDIISPWKSPYGNFGIVKGVACPQLYLESVSYRYGLRDNAGEQFSLRGDSIFYVPGTPVQEKFTGNNSTTTFTLANTALVYSENGSNVYALNVAVDGERKILGTDYTATATAVTFTVAPGTGAKISIVYGTATAGSYAQTVHEGLSVKPAAIKGKDIDVFFATNVTAGTVTNKALTSNVATLTTGASHGLSIGDTVVVAGVDSVFNGTYTVVATPTATTFTYAKTNANVTSAAVSPVGSVAKQVEVRWPDVQSVNIDWRITLEDDYEFGNPRSIGKEPTDVPETTGQIEIKPRSVDAFFTRLSQITGVPTNQIIGPQSSVAGALRVVLRNPESGGTTAVAAGAVLKTLYVPTARFTIPGYEGRVQQKLTTTVNFDSDDGVLEVYKGAKA
jgi:hypothetical protein